MFSLLVALLLQLLIDPSASLRLTTLGLVTLPVAPLASAREEMSALRTDFGAELTRRCSTESFLRERGKDQLIAQQKGAKQRTAPTTGEQIIARNLAVDTLEAASREG